MPKHQLRTIVESERFRKEKTILEPDTKRLDDALDGIINLIPANPQRGRQTNNPRIYAMTTEELSPFGYIVYYAFNDSEIELISIIKAIEET